VPRFVGGLLGKDYVATVRSLDIGLGHRDYPFSEWPRTPDEDAALAAIADLPHLRSLDIYFASLRDADLARLSHLTGLTYLGIKGAKLTGKAFGYLRGMTRLTELRAARYGMFPDPRASDWPAWVADDSDAVNFLEGMREIAWLDLEGRPIGDAHLSFLQGEHLHTLCLDNTAVTDAGMEILSRRIAPGHLDANGTRVTDRGAAAVARIRTIGIVGLGFTDVTDAAIRELAALPALWDLRIGNREHPERVTVKGVKALCRARSLRKLRLSGANFNTTQLDEIKAALPGVEVQCDNDPAALSIMRKREFTP
jgi:hypothetical protein